MEELAAKSSNTQATRALDGGLRQALIPAANLAAAQLAGRPLNELYGRIFFYFM